MPSEDIYALEVALNNGDPLNETFVSPLSKITPGAAATLTTVNVFDYGAQGDGETDDTAAIQATIDYVSSLPYGGVVLLPAGDFRVSAPLVIQTNSVSIVGQGPHISFITISSGIV